MIYRKQATFTSSGTFTLPSTALPSVDYDLCGGGGAGGAYTGTFASTAGASGGGGGGRKKGTITLAPGTSYSVVIGAGGLGANPNNDVAPGGDGGASSFAGITANGGKGGIAATSSGSTIEGGFSGDGTAPVRMARFSSSAGYSIVTPVVCMSAPGGGLEYESYHFALPGGIGFDSKCSGGGASCNDRASFGGPGAGNGYYGTTKSGGNATTPGSGGGGLVRTGGSSSYYGGNGFRGQLDVIYWDTVP